jgi:hypothetical protein
MCRAPEPNTVPLPMDELALIQDVVQRLDRAGLACMLTGSMAMSFYAEPRMTRDVDLVLEMEDADAERVHALFEDDYYVSLQAVREAVEHASMFNVIHSESLIKVDLIIRKDEPYRRVEFARRQPVRIGDVEVYLVSKEDLILSKLVWAKDSQSEQQLRDVQNLIGTGYDRDYLEGWLHELGLYPWVHRFLS